MSLGDEVLDGSLDDISKRFERSVLTRLYRTYPSTRKLAKRLGVSHTAIANKLREYGLSSRKGGVEGEERKRLAAPLTGFKAGVRRLCYFSAASAAS